MFVRCERCRAVYHLAANPSPAPVVRCGRCHQAFIAREPLRRLAVEGTLGGAADPTSVHPVEPGVATEPLPLPAPAPPPARARASAVRMATRQPPKKRGRGALVAGLVVLFAAGAFAAWKLGPAARPQLSKAAQAEADHARAELMQDDEAALESAIAAYDDLAQSHPDEAQFAASRAFATALLGATARAETVDLNAELTRLDHETFSPALAAEPDAAQRVAAIHAEQQDLRQRLGPVTARGAKLLHEAFEQAKAVLAKHDDAVDARRAQMLVAAATDQANVANSIARQLDEGDPWADYARGIATLQGVVTAAKAKAAAPSFEAALQKNPQLLRATWALGRAAVFEADWPRAKQLFESVLAKNPRHEGASRGLALVDGILAPSSPAPATVQTAAPPPAKP